MTKLDADLRALYELLSKDNPALAGRAREFAEIVQTARMALDERATPDSDGYVSTGGFTSSVTMGEAPLQLRVTIAVALEDNKPNPPLVRRADHLVEAIEAAFLAQVELLRTTLD
jgi:hypothetical protein